MRWLAVLAAVGSVVMLGLACGGPAFSVGSDGDAGPDGTTDVGVEAAADAGPDAAGDATGDAGGEAGSDAGPMETSTVDAPSVDAFEEPPATCTGGFACVAAIPAGWSGPLELYAGTSAVPPCSAMFASPQDANDVLTATAAGCSCLCGSAGIQCTTPQTVFYAATGCAASSLCASIVLPPSACTPIDETAKCDAGVTGISITGAQAGVADAGCPATTAVSLPPVSWATNARSCASSVTTAQLNCAAGSVCAPKPSAPFAATPCIGMAGYDLCPAGSYTDRHVFYGGVDDSRGCTACTCAAQGFSCSAKLDEYPATALSCSGLPNTYPAPFTCEVVQQPADLLMTITPTLGTCTPSQSTAQGAATPSKPLTICCAP